VRSDLAQQITDKIIKLMEENDADWRRPWLGDGIAKNIVSEKSYRGVNIPILGLSGYSSPWFGTYKQWAALGAQVRKSEKSTAIFFWKPLHIKDKETEEDRQILMARSYAVFSIEQVENAPSVKIETRPPLERHAECDRIIEATGAKITYGGDRAAYIPSQDRIVMPKPEQFLSPEGFYGTLCHEVTHWAGHESRLNRNLKGRFGSETYAFEELIGETGAALICAAAGIIPEPRAETAKYLNSWVKVLKNDKHAIISAFSHAQKAADFILGDSQQPGQEPTRPATQRPDAEPVPA
jgi:antirestriction protein ArdC